MRLILLLSLIAVAPAVPRADRITPELGGEVVWLSDDCAFAAGNQHTVRVEPYPAETNQVLRPYVWRDSMGIVWLDEIVGLPNNCWVQTAHETPSGYRLCLFAPGPLGCIQWMVWLPKTRPGDFDFDGDIDQSDYGYLQRQLGQPGMMTVAEFLSLTTGVMR